MRRKRKLKLEKYNILNFGSDKTPHILYKRHDIRSTTFPTQVSHEMVLKTVNGRGLGVVREKTYSR